RRTIPSSSTRHQPQLRIAYRIIRPSLLKPLSNQADKSQPAAPLIIIHGGPSLPSEYLTPLAQNHHLCNRTIIFYDQLGCGWSSIPQNDDWCGVLQMAQDLEELVCHLKQVENLKSFHLLGHSLGGAIGYEFIKRQIMESRDGTRSERDMPQCLSFILSNASTNFELSSREQIRLFHEFQLQHLQTRMPSKQQQTKSLSIKDQFFQTHICRTPSKPAELESALHRRGKDWSANDYTAMPLGRDIADAGISADSASNNRFPPVLIIRGEYDFVTEACTRGWNNIFALQPMNGQSKLKEVIIKECAHYPHFEQPDHYLAEVDKFCSTAEFQS
ncbi:hypothetical protein ACHAXR_001041, partial [Thalassiosira sp. AJA248-18]